MARYNARPKFRISKHRKSNKLYKSHLRKRGLKFIDIYSTPILAHPTAQQITNLRLIGHTWTMGDRFYKLAHKHYGDSELWWIIAWYNRTPTEAHLKVGDPITIPLPLERILNYLKI